MPRSMGRFSGVLALGLGLAALSACAPAQPLANPAPTALVDAASLLHDGGIVFAQYPAPRLENPNLVPIFVGKAGDSVAAETAKELLELTNGQKSGYLPEAGQTEIGVQLDSAPAPFGLLATTVSLNSGATVREGAGAGAPDQEARYAVAGLAADVPFFARRIDPSSSYALLALPDAVDLRADMPPVRDQGARNTGVAFATAAMLDNLAMHDPGLPIKQSSPQFLNWRYQIQIKSKLTDEKTRVWSARDTYETLFFSLLHLDGNPDPGPDSPYVPPLQGTISEQSCPYQPTLAALDPDTNILVAARAHLGDALTQQVVDHTPLTSQGAYFYRLKTDVASYKGAIAGGQPIQLSLPVYLPDWSHPDSANHYRLADMTVDKAKDANNLAYQALVIVGYESDAAAPGGGWFLLRNSWGTGWADGGHARVSFRTVMDFGYAAHIAVAYASTFQGIYDIFPPPDAPAANQHITLPPITDTEAWGSYTDATAAKEGATIQSLPTPPLPTNAVGLPVAEGSEGWSYADNARGFGSPAPGANGAVEPIDSPPNAPVVVVPQPTPPPATPAPVAPGTPAAALPSPEVLPVTPAPDMLAPTTPSTDASSDPVTPATP